MLITFRAFSLEFPGPSDGVGRGWDHGDSAPREPSEENFCPGKSKVWVITKQSLLLNLRPDIFGSITCDYPFLWRKGVIQSMEENCIVIYIQDLMLSPRVNWHLFWMFGVKVWEDKNDLQDRVVVAERTRKKCTQESYFQGKD